MKAGEIDRQHVVAESDRSFSGVLGAGARAVGAGGLRDWLGTFELGAWMGAHGCELGPLAGWVACGSKLGACDIGWVARMGAGSPWERMGGTRITLGLAD